MRMSRYFLPTLKENPHFRHSMRTCLSRQNINCIHCLMAAYSKKKKPLFSKPPAFGFKVSTTGDSGGPARRASVFL